MSPIEKSSKLENVCYDIRGPVLKEAKRLEEEGNKVLKLNIGNPAPFGFDAPDEILVDVIRNLPTAQGYCDSKVFTPRVKPSCSTTRLVACVMLPWKIFTSAMVYRSLSFRQCKHC